MAHGYVDGNTHPRRMFQPVAFHMQMKFLIYLWWVVGEDIESQQRGVICIFFPSFEAAHQLPDKKEAIEGDRVFGCIPTRMTALHNCSPDEPVYKLLQACVTLTMSAAMRARIQYHNGKV